LFLFLNRQLIKGRNAGTSLRTLFTNLESPTGKVADELAALGITTTDASGQFIGFLPVIDQLHTAFQGMTEAQQSAATVALFGKYAWGAMMELINAGPAGLAAYTAKENDLGTASDIAHTKMDNLAGSLHNFTSLTL